MAKKMIIKGVGTFMAKRLAKDGGTEVLTLGTLQNLRIDLNVEIEDIFGGDGLFAIDTLVSSKSIEVSATDAKFDLDAIRLVMGSNVQEGVMDTVWVLGEEAIVGADGTVLPSFADELPAAPEFSVRLKDSNRLLKVVAYDAMELPKQGEVAYNAADGSLVFSAGNAGTEVVFNYKRETQVDVVDLLVDEVPFPVHVVHHGSFVQKDGSYQGVETELYSCIANGSFSIDAARVSASASSISLRVIDPERADGKLGSIKRYTATSRV